MHFRSSIFLSIMCYLFRSRFLQPPLLVITGKHVSYVIHSAYTPHIGNNAFTNGKYQRTGSISLYKVYDITPNNLKVIN